jgi:hypothetical protein
VQLKWSGGDFVGGSVGRRCCFLLGARCVWGLVLSISSLDLEKAVSLVQRIILSPCKLTHFPKLATKDMKDRHFYDHESELAHCPHD